MEILLTLDYELFLLEPAEDIVQSLIQPTERFDCLLKKYNCKAVYFVDAGYLFALNRYRNQFPKAGKDLDIIINQLKGLVAEGNEIGLHVHPHWEDCRFEGRTWKMDLSRYKLSDFSKEEAAEIFLKYYAFLQSHFPTRIITFRAGGWCLEPFDYIRDAMIQCGIFIDSTVYYGGFSKSRTHSYDFRNYPQKDFWRFSKEPSIEDPDGQFMELPFTSYKLHPFIYWKVLLNRIVNKSRNKDLGHGVKPSFREVLIKLFSTTTHAVSMDSFKSKYLKESFIRNIEEGRNYFCVLGHPKCFTDLTYQKLEQLIQFAKNNGNPIITYVDKFQKDMNIQTPKKEISQELYQL